MVGLLFLDHGLNKLFDFPATPTHAPYALFTLVPGLHGILEVVGGLLIALGLFTRPVAFVLAGDDAAILYCFIFLYFFVIGAGVSSLDQLPATGTSVATVGSRA